MALIEQCQFYGTEVTSDQGTRDTAGTYVMMLVGFGRTIRTMLLVGRSVGAVTIVIRSMFDTILANRNLVHVIRISKRTHSQPGEDAEQHEIR